jgi:alpha-ribazole phosphatase
LRISTVPGGADDIVHGDMVKSRIYLLRHTRPAIDTSVCYGRTDVALAQTWQRDVEECLASVAPAVRIYSSPSTRCRTLAQVIGRRDGVDVRLDPRLLELDFGIWEGRRWEEIPRACIEEWAADLLNYAPGGGESLVSLWDRVHSFREEIMRDDGDVILVSHHGPLRALAAQLAGQPPKAMFTRQFPWGSITPSHCGQPAIPLR